MYEEAMIYESRQYRREARMPRRATCPTAVMPDA